MSTTTISSDSSDKKIYSIDVHILISSNSSYITSLVIHVKTENIDEFLDISNSCGFPPEIEKIIAEKVYKLESEIENKMGFKIGSFKGILTYTCPIGEQYSEAPDTTPDYIDNYDYSENE